MDMLLIVIGCVLALIAGTLLGEILRGGNK
jgi:hypothetical protein